uniref:Uncharacterized protein n=1 Tax=Physcomitrium patens TaxID=3218 RepID=A0A7I3ZNV7_PHYPA
MCGLPQCRRCRRDGNLVLAYKQRFSQALRNLTGVLELWPWPFVSVLRTRGHHSSSVRQLPVKSSEKWWGGVHASITAFAS